MPAVTESTTVYVLMWEYVDKSAYGFIGIYWEESKAKEIYELLSNMDITRNYRIAPQKIK